MKREHRSTALVAIACAALVGCGGDLQPRPQPAQSSEETFETFGNYEVHFNALRTDQLTVDIARTYGIQRSTNRVLLNVTILRNQGAGTPRMPVEGTVAVDAYNLSGQLKGLEMRRISEGTAIYYVGEVSISGNEILVFDISVTPAGETQPYMVKFKREFFAD